MKARTVKSVRRKPRKAGLLGAAFTPKCVAAGACKPGLAWLRGRPRTLADLKAHRDWYVWAIEHKCLEPEVVSEMGDMGTASAGYRGTASAGYMGTASAGDRGTASAGYMGTASAGDRGTASITGETGAIVSQFWDDNASRYRMVVGIVGEDGLKPNTKYTVRDGKFVEVAS